MILSRPSTCQVGNVFAIRTDGKPFTVADWCRLDDVGLNSVMDTWSEEGRSPSQERFERIKHTIQLNLERNRSYK